MTKRFEGEVALVTGAAGGIGRGIARALAAEGARVVAADIADGDAVANEIRAAGGEGAAVRCDLAGQDGWKTLLDAASVPFGAVSIFVHSASPRRAESQTVLKVTETEWDAMLNVNLRSGFFLAQGLARAMIAGGIPGRMLFVASLHAHTPRNLAHYSAAKAGQVMVVKELARALMIFSLTHSPKLNWTGPLWLAIVPGIAAGMTGRVRGFGPRLQRAWPATVAASLILLGGGALYIVLGMPGAPPLKWMAVPAAWRELTREVDGISARLREETGEEPIRTGVDLYFLAAEVSFYSSDRRKETITGRHITGRDSLMWERWAPAKPLVGRTLLLLARNRRDLEKPPLPDLFDRLSEIREAPIRRNGKVVVNLPWRVGYGYRGPP